MERVYAKTSLGDMFFDAVFRENHEQRTRITEHPVHIGAQVTDHAYRENACVTLEIGATDVLIGDGESATVYQTLLDLQEAREPMTLVTRLKNYDNMLIESVSASDDYTTMNALKATVQLREVKLVDTLEANVTRGTPKIQSADSDKTENTDGGAARVEDAGDFSESGLNPYYRQDVIGQ